MAQDNATAINPDDDLPVLADDAYEDETQGNDDYDIISELEDDERHILDMLTDGERDALGLDDGDHTDDAAAGADDDTTNEPEQPEENEGAAQQADEPAAQEENAPQATAALTDDDISQIDADIKAQRAALRDKWRDGDLTDQEFDDQDDALTASREAAIEAARAEKAQEAQEQARQALQNDLIAEARGLIQKHPQFLENNREHLMGLDRHVRAVADSPRYANLSAKDMMATAMRLYAAEGREMGFDVPGAAEFSKPAPKPKEQQKAKQEAPKPKPQKPEPPKTLARVPAAATNSTVDGKWGALQHIMETGTVDEQERAMAQLSDDEREYFASLDLGD